MNNTIKSGILTGAFAVAAEAVNYLSREGTIAGLKATLAPTYALGAAAVTAVLADKVAVKALDQITKAVPQTSTLLNKTWVKLVLRGAIDAGAAAAVAVTVFGVALNIAALAPVLIVGTLPAALDAFKAVKA